MQKLDTDVENISAEGKKNIIVWGMPDYDKAVDKVPEELYTAPLQRLCVFTRSGKSDDRKRALWHVS
ncbi:MAG: hypothetical protein ACLU99_12145 [Alphaproteobacteria bacterium]